MIAILDGRRAQLVAPRDKPMLHIPVRLVCCPTCQSLPGSPEAHSCTRIDCGLADRLLHEDAA